MIYKIDHGKEELLNLLSKYDIHAEPYVLFERKGVIKLIVQNIDRLIRDGNGFNNGHT